jgi:Sec-independent protein secretion pathway component TatC
MKVIKWILIGLGVIFAYYLIQAFMGGFSSEFAPQQAIERAQQKAAENKK